MTRHYQCCECDRRFSRERGLGPCPHCGSLYMRWLNFEQFRVNK